MLSLSYTQYAVQRGARRSYCSSLHAVSFVYNYSCKIKGLGSGSEYEETFSSRVPVGEYLRVKAVYSKSRQSFEFQ